MQYFIHVNDQQQHTHIFAREHGNTHKKESERKKNRKKTLNNTESSEKHENENKH